MIHPFYKQQEPDDRDEFILTKTQLASLRELGFMDGGRALRGYIEHKIESYTAQWLKTQLSPDRLTVLAGQQAKIHTYREIIDLIWGQEEEDEGSSKEE